MLSLRSHYDVNEPLHTKLLGRLIGNKVEVSVNHISLRITSSETVRAVSIDMRFARMLRHARRGL